VGRRGYDRDETEPKRGRRRSKRMGMARMLGMAAFLPIAGRAPLYLRLIWDLVRDERMPGNRKVVLAGALGYLVVGRDLIPDDVPLLGGLDDLIVLVLAVDVFIDGVPDDLLEEKLDELDIDPGEFRADVARIRRATPGPIRRAVRSVPQVVDFVGGAVEQSGVGPRIRRFIKEGSSA
jgi:uncharacterized membrane protein YkvA (DUF1232 family)